MLGGMAVFEFTLTGKVEVDADALGVAVANSVKTQPGSEEIDVEFGFRYRTDPTLALRTLLQMGFVRIMNEKLPDTHWTPHEMTATAEQAE